MQAQPRELLICTALASEAETLVRGARRRRGAVPDPGELHDLADASGRSALGGFTGMGSAAVERFFAALGASPETRPRRVVFGGLAGALRPDLAPGSLVLCESAVRVASTPEPAALPSTPALVNRLARAFESTSLPFTRGLVLEVARIEGGPDAKRALAARHPQAHVVAMEDAAAIHAARALEAEIAIVRVVIDGLEDSLPDLSPALDAAGRPRPLAFAAHLARHPSAVLALPALARNFSVARTTLDRALKVAVAALA